MAYGDEEDFEAPDLKLLQAQAEVEARLKGLSTEDIIRAGHRALLIGLVAKAELQALSHQEQAILRNLLRDNGMVLGVPPEGAVQSDQPKNRPLDLPEYGDGERYN